MLERPTMFAHPARVNRFLAYYTPSTSQHVTQHSAGPQAHHPDPGTVNDSLVMPGAHIVAQDDMAIMHPLKSRHALDAKGGGHLLQHQHSTKNRSYHSTVRRGRPTGVPPPPAPVPPPAPYRDRYLPSQQYQQQQQQIQPQYHSQLSTSYRRYEYDGSAGLYNNDNGNMMGREVFPSYTALRQQNHSNAMPKMARNNGYVQCSLPPQMQRPIHSFSTSSLPTTDGTSISTNSTTANVNPSNGMVDVQQRDDKQVTTVDTGISLRCPSNSVLLKSLKLSSTCTDAHSTFTDRPIMTVENHNACNSMYARQPKPVNTMPTRANFARKASSSILSYTAMLPPDQTLLRKTITTQSNQQKGPLVKHSSTSSVNTNNSKEYATRFQLLSTHHSMSNPGIIWQQQQPILATKSNAELQRELNLTVDEEYGEDILAYSLEREVLFMPTFKAGLASQSDIPYQQQLQLSVAATNIKLTPSLRRTLIEGIITICDALGLKTETMHLSVMAFDCFLAQALNFLSVDEQPTIENGKHVPPPSSLQGLKLRWDHFQLAIITSVFSCSKFSETKDTTPFLSTILQITNRLFSAHEVVRFECRHFLPVLNYEISIPTPDYYLHLILGSASGIVSIATSEESGEQQTLTTSNVAKDKACLLLRPHERTLLLVIARFVVESCMSDYEWSVLKPTRASVLAVVGVLIAGIVCRKIIALPLLFEKLPWLRTITSFSQVAILVDRAFTLVVNPPPIVLQKYNRQNNYNIATIMYNYLYSCKHQPYSYTSTISTLQKSTSLTSETTMVESQVVDKDNNNNNMDVDYSAGLVQSPGDEQQQLIENNVHMDTTKSNTTNNKHCSEDQEIENVCKKRTTRQHNSVAVSKLSRMLKKSHNQRRSSLSLASSSLTTSPSPSSCTLPEFTHIHGDPTCTAMTVCEEKLTDPLLSMTMATDINSMRSHLTEKFSEYHSTGVETSDISMAVDIPHHSTSSPCTSIPPLRCPLTQP